MWTWLLQLKEDTGEKLSRGTRITLHLKEDAHDLADDKKLGSLIKQYSEFISFPIKLWSSSQDYKQACFFPAASRPPPLSPASHRDIILSLLLRQALVWQWLFLQGLRDQT